MHKFKKNSYIILKDYNRPAKGFYRETAKITGLKMWDYLLVFPNKDKASLSVYEVENYYRLATKVEKLLYW